MIATGVGVKRAGRWLVRGIDFRVAPGEFVALVGPNGAGKSTLLGCLAGDLACDEGEVTLDDTAIARIDPTVLATRRAVLSQRSELPATFTALEVVLLGRFPHRDETAASSHTLAHTLLERVGLQGFAARPMHALSGGEQQRVHLARVLAQLGESGRWLLLDEPTTYLDLAQQHVVLHHAKACTARGVGVVAVLHDLPLAARYADRVVILSNGQRVADAAPDEAFTTERLREVWGIDFTLLRVDNLLHPVATPSPSLHGPTP